MKTYGATSPRNGIPYYLQFISIVLLGTSVVQTVLADAAGRVGRSGAAPGRDCTNCHVAGAPVPQVTLTGPATVAPSSTNSFSLTMTGGPAGNAGLDVSASGGTLVATDPNTQLLRNEITHNGAPTAIPAGGSITYVFDWTAPATPGTATVFAAGLIGNGDNADTGDGTVTTSLVISVGGAGPAPAPGPTNPTNPTNPTGPGPLAAVITAPTAGTEGIAINLDGSASTSPSGIINAFDWDFGDGNIGTGAAVTNTFAVAGTYTVTLTITDDTGATTASTQDIVISVAGAGGPGLDLYIANCESCHAPNGAGLPPPEGPNIQGANAEAIADAIATVAEMQSLATLAEADIAAIAEFLASVVPVSADGLGRSYGSRNAFRSQTKEQHDQSLERGALSPIEAVVLALVTLIGWRAKQRHLKTTKKGL